MAANPVLRRIAEKRLTAQWVLFVEHLLPRLIWPTSILALFASLSWFGIFRILPFWPGKALAILMAAAFLFSLKGFASLRWPSRQDGETRLEKTNELRHQAIASLHDVPANSTPQAIALWREHQNRMLSKIRRLHAGLPAPGISRLDPYGLRVIPMMLLAIGFAYSGSNAGGNLSDAFLTELPVGGRIGMRADIWVTPPAYTGRAPLFLTHTEGSNQDVSVPENSQVTIRLSGSGAAEGKVSYRPENAGAGVVLKPETPKSQPDATEAPSDSTTYILPLEHSGQLDAVGNKWNFAIEQDRAPRIAFDGEPKRAVSGALEIGFIAEDDYGISNAHAEIVPADPADMGDPLYPLPEYRLDLPHRARGEVKGLTSRNLSEHPLSGKRVYITLVGQDEAGQIGRSEPYEMILPTRRFTNPLAAAAAEERQVFALNKTELARAKALNEALFLRPEETIPNLSHFLLLNSAGSRMNFVSDDETMKALAEYLWEIALGIEDGDLSLAERRLRDAQERLSEALERGASQEDVAKLMQELREAFADYMQELAKNMQSVPPSQMQQQDAQNLMRQQDLERMMDQIQNLAQSGARDEARNLLNEMQRMLNNLDTARRQPGNNQQNSQMNQQLDQLGKLLQEQKQLMDETFSTEQALRDRMQRGDPNDGGEDGMLFEEDSQSGDEKGPYDNMTEDELREALKDLQSRQEALENGLGELRKGLKDLGLEPGDNFGDAGKAMGEATGELGRGRGGSAVDAQGRAIEALRQGASELMKQLSQRGKAQQGQGITQTGPGSSGLDPLGRPLRSNGPDFGENVKIPDEIDIQRAREILEEIRRKLGESASPELERQYLERLLDIK